MPPQRFLRISFDFEKALPLYGGGAFCCLQRCRLTRGTACVWRGEVAEIIGEDGTDDFVLPTAETTPGEIEKRATALRSASERLLQSTVMVVASSDLYNGLESRSSSPFHSQERKKVFQCAFGNTDASKNAAMTIPFFHIFEK